ncbi:hypothetical protein CUJ83_08420 [Methanocella sp. CWC-04]|uniref:Uncharacterized protein n=2 Tax=Methanooceanicella nereidis TaxID=2052831 RepID=A0AAP2W7A5_9EURY|nr:hypothetical protein [Methanocella sp. CWC-04]
MLRALLYRDLIKIGSIRQLVKVLGSDKNIVKIFGLNSLPDYSPFSKFKKLLSKHIDRITTPLNNMARLPNPDSGFLPTPEYYLSSRFLCRLEP